MIDYGHGIALGPVGKAQKNMLSWRNAPAIYKWCRQHSPLEYWQHDEWLESLKTRSDVKMFSVYLDPIAIGVCGLTSIDLINRHAEFSLYIAPDHHKNGYGEKALKTLVEYGFKVLGLNHIFGETFDGNPAAKMFEKVGFKFEGTRRKYYYREGQFIDAHLYSILNEAK